MQLYGLKQVRTNNFTDPNMVNKIQRMWAESFPYLPKQEPCYGVYHSFESNYQGDYTLTVASEVTVTKSLLTIDEQANYQKFVVDPAQENGIYQAWQKIWQLEAAGQLTRAYKQDFEYYESNGNISIHIELIT